MQTETKAKHTTDYVEFAFARWIVDYPLPHCETDAEKLERLMEFMRTTRNYARDLLAEAQG
jgi:hypothetical protein